MADPATTAIGPGVPPPMPAGQGRERDGAGLRRTVGYVGGKVAGAIVSLLAVIFTSFFLFRIIPGDPVRTMTHGRPVSIEQKEALAREYGLRVEQFVDYVNGVIRFDLGDSFQYNKPVTELIADRLGPTVLLVGTSVVIAALVGLALGVNGAWNHGSTSDRVSTGVALTLSSVPTFWLGLILIVVFASGADLFPTGGMKTPGMSGWETIPDVAHHMVLPVITLVAVGVRPVSAHHAFVAAR